MGFKRSKGMETFKMAKIPVLLSGLPALEKMSGPPLMTVLLAILKAENVRHESIQA